jgi:hypothetical protein
MFTYNVQTSLVKSKFLEYKRFSLTCGITIKEKFSNNWYDYVPGDVIICVNDGFFMKNPTCENYVHVDISKEFIEKNKETIFNEIR